MFVLVMLDGSLESSKLVMEMLEFIFSSSISINVVDP